MKKTRTLVGSLVAIVICFTMLLGTTYAWFTDSISSTNNIIKTGDLKVNAYWMEATKDPTTDTWTKFSDAAIFNNDKWEPGYVEAKHLKLTNDGSLAFKYKLAIQPNGEVTDLADVIDVYYFATATRLTARSEVETGAYVGTLADLIADPDGAAYGILLPEGATPTSDKEVEKEVKVTIAFKMKEDLGNEYQGKSIGSSFDIVVYATQYEFENDSFGNDYDNGATIDDAILAHGGVIDLEGDITEAKTVAEGAKVVINMNDNTMSDTLTNNGEVTINDGTIEVADAGLDNFGTATLTNVVMNAGSASDYSNRTSGSDAQTTYDNVEINSAGGGVGASDGATVTFNSGSVDVNSKSTSGRYHFYVVGEGTELTINDGNFDFNRTQNQKRAYIYVGEGATVYVNGGTFGKASTRSGYTAGILGDGDVIISGGTFGFDPSNWVAVGYEAVKADGVWTVSEVADKSAELDEVIKAGKTEIVLGAGNYIIPDSAQGKTLTIIGNGNTNIATQDDGSYEGCDYSLDGATVTFKNVVINTDSRTYTGYARLKATYENCTINGTYTLYGDSVFNGCEFNVSGDVYNIWTWGAPNATFNNCTFNSDGKAMLLYGQANTKLTLNDCTFNDNGGLTDLKAAVEIGNDYNTSYELIVNNTVVNGYEINDKGINTGSTLWANKNSMGTDKLNVVVDGVDVY